MKIRKNLYILHRWLALIISLQLLAWSVGGFMFSILDIDNVRGDWDRNTDPPAAIPFELAQVGPGQAAELAEAAGVATDEVAQLVLRVGHDEQLVYDLLGRDGLPLATVDAQSGQVTRQINDETAAAAALHDFVPEASVVSVQLLEGEPPSEYRGRPMPVYQVVLDHPKHPHIYVSPVNGEVITRRNAVWRTFDFFWMLHTMDYQTRDNFNHWLLTVASVLAIATSVTGLAIWVGRIPRRRKKPTEAGETG